MSASAFPGQPAPSDARYETLRTLGQGGAGAVYLARDRDTGEVIALKKLLRMDPKSVLRLKREFRSLADIHHRNLVHLYDLGCGPDGWFLTMEYIDGPDLLSYVASGQRSLSGRDVTTTRELGDAPGAVSPDELQHTLAAFQQLATGVRALHRAGMLHRDLKPSNVLVADHRVVVLDFGLVRGLDSEDLVLTQDGVVSGTPAYMAPEQASAQSLDEGADWYAFGVMLYEALTGELPIEGRNAMELVVRKSTVEPPSLARVAPQLPRELSALCDGLLRRDPKLRTTGDEVLSVLDRLLGERSASASSQQSFEISITTQTHAMSGRAALVGRNKELDQLDDALADVRDVGAVVVHVRGASGAGKTTLVQQFVDRLEEGLARLGGAGPLVLRSRCNEREAMPYKALDGVMDALVRHLLDLNDFDLGRLLPVDVAELAQLFPVLHRVPGLRRLLNTTRPLADALQARVRAEAALRELFSRLAARRPLVLWIDDLQWGDLDSASILKLWPEQLATSHVLMIFSYRSAEMDTSACLRALLERPARAGVQVARERVIQVNALGDDDVRTLCERPLGPIARERPELVERIARESQGSPFLVLQLAALVQAKFARGETDLGELSIEQLVDQATELLPVEAKRTVAVLAVGGRPMEPKIVLRAASVRSEGRALLQALRRLRLIRSRDVGGRHLLEVYHDRVREGVQASLDPAERIQIHAALLDALESDSDSDPSWLHTLALGAGQRASALRYGLVAAGRAEATLAFERAAELYLQCIELTDVEGDNSRLRVRLADALARGGHGVRAAEAYLEAAKYVDSAAAGSCMRFAASHFMRTGEWARSEAIVREVFKTLDISVPETDAGVIAAILWERAALKLRGLDFKWATEPPPPELLQTIDLYTTLSVEYQAYDPLRAALFQARSLRLALASRDPWRVARAFCANAVTVCVGGSERGAREADALLKRADDLARETKIEPLRGSVLAARAVCSYLLGRSTDIIEPSIEAERCYRTHNADDPAGDYFYRFVVVACRIGTLNYLGRNQLATAELERVLSEARATNNRNAVLQLTLCQTVADGLMNRYQDSKQRLDEERKLLPPGRFGPLHVLHMIAVMRTACGLHDYSWADAWLEEAWTEWKRSVVRRSAFLSMLALGTRIRYVMNRHVEERREGDLAAELRPELRAVARLPYDEARIGLRARAEARLSYLKGDLAAAIESMRKVVGFVEHAGAQSETAREKYALGFLLGNTEEGSALRAENDRRLRELGCSQPLAEVFAHYPELRNAKGVSG